MESQNPKELLAGCIKELEENDFKISVPDTEEAPALLASVKETTTSP